MSLDKTNKDDVFMRVVTVGVCSFLYDMIEIRQTESGNSIMKKVPFYYSDGGDEQFMTDHFLNTDKYCKELGAEGNVNTVPSGRITLVDANPTSENLTAKYSMATHIIYEETEFGTQPRREVARTTFIPIAMKFEVKVKCGSTIERWKIYEKILLKLHKTSTFHIRYNGFRGIPVQIALPERYEAKKNFQFQYPADNKRPMLTFDIEVVTHLPQIDESTTQYGEETIETFDSIVKIKPKDDAGTEESGQV